MELNVYSVDKKEVGKIPLPEEIFGASPRKGLIYQVVVQQEINRRHGNARVKNRHEVKGSTRKIYRQKGTGRARHGDIKAPIFVGGGRAFGPKPRDWSSVIPRQIRRQALRDLVLMKQREGKLWVLDALEIKQGKTKEAAAIFDRFGISSALVVLPERDLQVERAIRNLPNREVTDLGGIKALDLLRYDHLLMTREGFETLLRRFNGKTDL